MRLPRCCARLRFVKELTGDALATGPQMRLAFKTGCHLVLQLLQCLFKSLVARVATFKVLLYIWLLLRLNNTKLLLSTLILLLKYLAVLIKIHLSTDSTVFMQ